MTHLERKIYILLWLFIGAGIFTGTITAFAPIPETEYIPLRQAVFFRRAAL